MACEIRCRYKHKNSHAQPHGILETISRLGKRTGNTTTTTRSERGRGGERFDIFSSSSSWIIIYYLFVCLTCAHQSDWWSKRVEIFFSRRFFIVRWERERERLAMGIWKFACDGAEQWTRGRTACEHKNRREIHFFRKCYLLLILSL